MFMASSWTGSWPLGVILTLRRDVFICGDTDVMVPWTMVPGRARPLVCAAALAWEE